jgi:hypothetical protein
MKQQNVTEKVAVTKFETKTDSNGIRYMRCENSIPDGKFWKGYLCNNWCKAGNDVASILCWKCSAILAGLPESRVEKQKSDKPKGWKFMKVYVHTDGSVYYKGEEQPSLKGTLPVTVMQPKEAKQRLSKEDKQKMIHELGTEIESLKAKLFSETRKGKRAEVTKALAKANRQLKKLM